MWLELAVIAALGGGGAYAYGKRRTRKMFEDRYKGILKDLHPDVAERAVKLLTEADKQGIKLAITSGYRSNEEQQRLYSQGRTTPGSIVTNAKPGTSWHNWRRAFDVAPLNEVGKPHWPNNEALWNKIGAIGKSVGLSWGGDWTSFKDRPHFEYHPGLTIQDMMAGKS